MGSGFSWSKILGQQVPAPLKKSVAEEASEVDDSTEAEGPIVDQADGDESAASQKKWKGFSFEVEANEDSFSMSKVPTVATGPSSTLAEESNPEDEVGSASLEAEQAVPQVIPQQPFAGTRSIQDEFDSVQMEPDSTIGEPQEPVKESALAEDFQGLAAMPPKHGSEDGVDPLARIREMQRAALAKEQGAELADALGSHEDFVHGTAIESKELTWRSTENYKSSDPLDMPLFEAHGSGYEDSDSFSGSNSYNSRSLEDSPENHAELASQDDHEQTVGLDPIVKDESELSGSTFRSDGLLDNDEADAASQDTELETPVEQTESLASSDPMAVEPMEFEPMPGESLDSEAQVEEPIDAQSEDEEFVAEAVEPMSVPPLPTAVSVETASELPEGNHQSEPEKPEDNQQSEPEFALSADLEEPEEPPVLDLVEEVIQTEQDQADLDLVIEDDGNRESTDSVHQEESEPASEVEANELAEEYSPTDELMAKEDALSEPDEVASADGDAASIEAEMECDSALDHEEMADPVENELESNQDEMAPLGSHAEQDEAESIHAELPAQEDSSHGLEMAMESSAGDDALTEADNNSDFAESSDAVQAVEVASDNVDSDSDASLTLNSAPTEELEPHIAAEVAAGTPDVFAQAMKNAVPEPLKPPTKLRASGSPDFGGTLAIDPITGMPMSFDEMNLRPDLLLDDEPAPTTENAKGHYKPGYVPANVHSIDVSDRRFDEPNEEEDSGGYEILEDATSVADCHIDDILRFAIEHKASDCHLTAGLPPMMRLDGEIAPMPFTALAPEDSKRLIFETLTDEQLEKFETTHELDFAYTVRGLSRFRFNVFMQRGAVAGALRAIPTRIPSFETLGLPPVIRELSKRTSGLILVTGPTGSGKSTTIASMIDDINETRTSHIVTLEDPIEYLHRHKKCMVNQRELHSDTYSLHNALRAVLREDPDIILVGELRDLETIEAALTLAETGHLVFGTLHTRNAPASVDRVVDVFPSDQQAQIRVLLGNTLEGIVSQQLLPKLGGGRCAALEIMVATPAIKNLIREGKTHQMYSSIETGGQLGMQTMDSSLANFIKLGYCSYDECLMRAVDKESFARLAKTAA